MILIALLVGSNKSQMVLRRECLVLDVNGRYCGLLNSLVDFTVSIVLLVLLEILVMRVRRSLGRVRAS